jgi:ATP-dependent RNA helicase DeaD
LCTASVRKRRNYFAPIISALVKKVIKLSTFAELGLSKPAVARIEAIGFKEPTEIQKKTIATIIAGADLMGSAETGSGKTAAYALPIIDLLKSPARVCQALVLVPTRELAIQVQAEFDRFLSSREFRTIAVYGGCGYGKQISELRRNPAIVVATPGRLLDLIARRLVNLASIQCLVLDEADRLMDLGFMPQVRKIIACLPKQRQTIMFSATVDDRIERLAQEYLRKPVRVQVRQERLEPISIKQEFHRIKEGEKDNLLLQLVQQEGVGSVLVFTRTRRKADTVARRLRDANVKAREIHGDIGQNQRERTLEQYRKGQFTVLVATDVAARGLDIPAITHVVNYDIPQSPADYVHRIGRTGRAGRAGCSHTFFAIDDMSKLRDIERLIGRSLYDRSNDPAPIKSAESGRRFRWRTRARAR